MNRIELNDRFADMWRKSREDGGKSQDYMAKALGVSKKTVQNWEQGTSCPSQEKGFEWFIALDRQPLPYYLQLLYPIEFENASGDMSDEDVTSALIRIIADLPTDVKRKLLYLLYGDHGSSPIAVLEMVTAHLQTPLRSRLNVAEIVRTNYEVAESLNAIQKPEHIQPNIAVLNRAFLNGKEAVKKGNNSYSIVYEEVINT